MPGTVCGQLQCLYIRFLFFIGSFVYVFLFLLDLLFILVRMNRPGVPAAVVDSGSGINFRALEHVVSKQLNDDAK